MKILILSCATGEGHNSCAKALQKEMEVQGLNAEVQDTLALVSKTLSQSVSNAYVFSTKGPVFQASYKIGSFVSERFDSLKSPVYRVNRLYAKYLYDYILNNNFDAVVCVHLFPAEAMTALHRKAKLCVPTYFISTDYTCIPFLSETELDYYIIPHEHLLEEFVEKGIAREKLFPIGIPIDEEKFCTRMNQLIARNQMMKIMNWPDQMFQGHWYLIMSGSMGFGHLGCLIDNLIKRIRANDSIICVCGNNKSIFNTLKAKFNQDTKVQILGFISEVSILMDASDVILSKPGGLTSTETISKGIPLVHTEPIPGVESENARFFHYHNLSYHTDDVNQQVHIAMRLCEDSTYRERMISAQKNNANPFAATQIVQQIKKDLSLTKG